MPTADYNYEDFEQAQQAKQDQALMVKFYVKAMQDSTASIEEGRPIFREREFVEIRVAGSKEFVARPATPADKQRFAPHYERFKARIAEPEVGTPLSEWTAVTSSQVEELKFFNIKTVEQLANTSDSNGANFMGFNNLKRKAVEWMEKANQGVKESEFVKTIAAQQAQIDALMARLDAPSVTVAAAPPEIEDEVPPNGMKTVDAAPAKPKSKRRSRAKAK